MSWKPIELETHGIDAADQPGLAVLVDDLASGSIPAVIFRNAISSEGCKAIIDRLVERELLFDPADGVPDRFRSAGIPEGHYREGNSDTALQAWRNESDGDQKLRIDIGSSLGYRGSDREAFLTHSAESNKLFDSLFDGLTNPVDRLYDSLANLAVGKDVKTAVEPDGRKYGQAIIRAHYGGYSYAPHFDSVRRREKRTDYQAYRFEYQFAGVLVLQKTVLDGVAAQCRIHRCFWEPEVQPYLSNNNFHDYAEAQKIPNADIILEPGDLYFFNTGCIHEVPGVAGDDARVVLATFIGYSPDDPEVYVWS